MTTGRGFDAVSDTRLIERWLPIAALGIESVRERTPMTPFPAPNRLHVWWARRPLVASRAAVLASLLPADADRERFLHVLGIHGDPVAAKKRILIANRKGERLGAGAYGYPRAFGYTPSIEDRNWLAQTLPQGAAVLDPTAGGGSVPFESVRLGLETHSNDLNPVATLVERATLEWPAKYGDEVKAVVEDLGGRLRLEVCKRLAGVFPEESESDMRADGYLWARTVACPHCGGRVPLSPNWRLAPDGTGVRLKPHLAAGPGERVCSFEIVASLGEQSAGTVARGDAVCPFGDCRRVERRLKSGKRGKDRWLRGYRAPRPQDDNGAQIAARLAEKLPEWEAFDIVPNEGIPDGNSTSTPRLYGMGLWRDMFSPRQLLCHGTGVEVFRELLEDDRAQGRLSELREAAYGYLALALDTLLNYNNRSGVWDSVTGRGIRHLFGRHDFGFVWSYAEMAPLVAGVGYDWAINKTAKCIGELVALLRSDGGAGGLFAAGDAKALPVTVTCKPGDALDHIADHSIDAVVMDPPYYDNVMYADLSDFFYVWLKRTAGHLFPDLFRRRLTDKENEAVANPARFRGRKGARALAGRDYRQRMARMFAECRRVLKPEGIMVLMFTHKASGAWDALAAGLMEAGFAITASWPVNTESEGGLHIKNKAAANSTVFLACRPRAEGVGTAEGVYWEDVEPVVARAVRQRVAEFQGAGIAGVDLYLACFGPALEEFSRHWPLKRGRPRAQPRRRPKELFEEPWDPFAATPEDALAAARREVKRWRLQRLTHRQAGADLDAATAFFVLAWDAFEAPVFPYDEALQLARAVGVDLDRQVVGRLAEKKGSDIRLWDSARRAAKGALGPADGSRATIDAIHHGARRRPQPRHGPPGASCWNGTAWRASRAFWRPWKRCWRCCRSPGPSPASTCKGRWRPPATTSRRCGS